MSENPNVNCLEGFQCPECGYYESFAITINGSMLFHDDGGWDIENISYKDDSVCVCQDCNFCGQVVNFIQGGDR